MRIKQGVVKILSLAVANGAGVALDVSNYKEIGIQVYTTGTTTATIKFAVSRSLVQPNFASAPSATNVYDYVDITPLNSQTPIVGGTGIAITGTDIIKLYQIDTNFVKWICPIVSGYSAGSINCDLDACNDYTR